jgi:hypothetical protein
MNNVQYDNIQDLVRECKETLIDDLSDPSVRYRFAASLLETYEFLDTGKHKDIKNFLTPRLHSFEFSYPLEKNNPKYNEEIEDYRRNVQELFEYLQNVKRTLFNGIPKIKFLGNSEVLQTLINFFDKAVNFDFNDVNNRYLCSAELWGFLPEIDRSQNPELYKLVEGAAEKLDIKPISSEDPYNNEEQKDYKYMVSYTLEYLKNCI